MNIILDLIVVAIIALTVILSVKRGFVRSAVELAGFVLAVVLAFNLGPVLADTTYESVIREPVAKTVAGSLDSAVGEQVTSLSDKVWSGIPSFITSNAEKFGITRDVMDSSLNAVTSNNTADIALELTDKVVKPVAVAGLKVVYGFLIFIILAILAKILAKPINKLFSISFVGTLNRLLGAVLGLGKGIVYAILFCAIISIIVIFTDSGFLIFTKENIEASTVFKWLCELNPIY